MAFAGAMPQFSGTYSYKNTTTYARQLEGTLFLLIEPLDITVARVRFEQRVDDAPAQPVPIPPGYQLLHGDTLALAARIADDIFIITWVADYHLTRQDEGTILKISNQKQQAIQPL